MKINAARGLSWVLSGQFLVLIFETLFSIYSLSDVRDKLDRLKTCSMEVEKRTRVRNQIPLRGKYDWNILNRKGIIIVVEITAVNLVTL